MNDCPRRAAKAPALTGSPRRARHTGRVTAAAGALVLSLVWPALAAAQAMVVPAPQNVLSLSAEASAEVVQDRLGIVLAAQEEGNDAALVQSRLRDAMDAALKKARPQVRDQALEVRTGGFNVSPRYTSKPNGGSQISGWIGRAELIIEGTDTAAVSRLAGALEPLLVQRVGFSLSREAQRKAESQVSTEAIARFREQAERHAKAFGFGAYSLREVRVDAGRAEMASPAVMMRSAVAMSSAADAKAQPVEAGKTTVMVTVSGSVQLSAR